MSAPQPSPIRHIKVSPSRDSRGGSGWAYTPAQKRAALILSQYMGVSTTARVLDIPASIVREWLHDNLVGRIVRETDDDAPAVRLWRQRWLRW